MSVASQKRHPFSVISFEGTGKNQLDLSQESVGDAPVLLLCYFLRNPGPKPTGVLEHCCERETKFWFFIFRGFSFWPHL
jgi:hypothetical protein